MTVIPVAGIRLIAAMAILGMSAAACTNAESQPSSTSAAPATTTTATTTPATTTTVETPPEGPRTLEEFRFLEPGEYATTEFQPTILFSLERNYVLQFLERPTFISFTNRMLYRNETPKYKWVDFLALWADDPPDQVLDTFARSFGFDHQDPVPVSVGGLPGTASPREWFRTPRPSEGKAKIGGRLATQSSSAEIWSAMCDGTSW